MIAITRAVPDSLPQCELTHQQRVPIDVVRARREHEQYQAALRDAGCSVISLPALHDQPDSVFVEDTAFVVEDLGVMARPGAASRRKETASMQHTLERYLRIEEIAAPGTLDGGDVLRIGRRVFVGLSTRTNQAGAEQLARFIEPLGYGVTTVRVAGFLHLKSAATALSDELIVVNVCAIDPAIFGVRHIAVPQHEPLAANVLAIGRTVLSPTNAPETATLIEQHGFKVIAVQNAELAKAEAGLTCCSLLFDPPVTP